MPSVPGSEMRQGVDRGAATLPDAGVGGPLRLVEGEVEVEVDVDAVRGGLSDLDEARDTGRTGDVVFVSVDAQRAFSRAVEEGSAVARLADVEGGGDAQPGGRGARLLRRGVPAALLLGVIAFSYHKLAQIDSRRATPTISGGSTGEGELAVEDAPPVEEPESIELPPLPDRGDFLAALLEHEVERVRPDAAPEFVRLGQGVIATQQVTVINLWATWCGPCKSELPDLKEMFQRAGWGEKVRFVSILSGDEARPATAFKSYAAKMPSDEFFMVELNSSDKTIAEALKKRGRIEALELPITMVLDCRRTVRFAHQGRLSAKNFEELQGQIDVLVADIEQEYCDEKPQRRRRVIERRPDLLLQVGGEPREELAPTPEPETELLPVRVPAGRPASTQELGACGDTRCSKHENCHSCPEDCGCPVHNRCEKVSGGYSCVLEASVLKD